MGHDLISRTFAPEIFQESRAKIRRGFGITGQHGIVAAFVIAPWVTTLIYFLRLLSLKNFRKFSDD